MTRNVDVTAVVLAGCIVTSICVRFMFGHFVSRTWRFASARRDHPQRQRCRLGCANLTVECMMRSDVGKVPSTTTIAATRREFALGSRPGIVVVNNADEICRPWSCCRTYSPAISTPIADDIQVVELSRVTDIVLFAGDEREERHGGIRRGGGGNAGGGGIRRGAAKVIGFLNESFARRRYVEEIDKATRGVLREWPPIL